MPQYYAWYEMYPLAPVTYTGLHPGDAIRVSVYFNGSAYNLSLLDLTTGGSINTRQRCPSGSTCHNSSAEVITEDLGRAEPVVNLADFGMDNITGASVTSGSGKHGTLTASKLWTSSEIVMRDRAGAVMDKPSHLYGGQAFNVAWRSAS